MGDVRRYFPLTHAQKRIWYTEKMYPGTSVSNIASTNLYKSNLDIDILIKSIHFVVQSHDALRLRLVEIDGEVKQFVSDHSDVRIETCLFETIEMLQLWADENAKKPFELINHPLIKFTIISTRENQTGFFMNLHHMVADAWSSSMVSNQIWDVYWNLVNEEPLAELPKPSYLEAIENESNYLGSKIFSRNMEFWNTIYEELPDPIGFDRGGSNKRLDAKRKEFYLSESLTADLRDFCSKNSITLFHFLFACFMIYVYRKTGKKDIEVGTLTHNRSGAKEKAMIGMFVNTIAFRYAVLPEQGFLEYVVALAKNFGSVLRHQKFPYDELLKQIREKHNYQSDLIETVFSYDNVSYSFDNKWYHHGAELIPLVIHVSERETSEKLKFEIDYRIDSFEAWEIDQIQSFFLSLLKNALELPDKPVGLLAVMDRSEKEHIFHFNQPRSKPAAHWGVHQQFEYWAEYTPNQIAVVEDHCQITYGQLNEKANRLAHALRKQGVGPDTMVAMHLPRSSEMLVAMLGILKAGGAYLPIATDLPKNRIDVILEDSNVKIAITLSRYQQMVSGIESVFCLDNSFWQKESSSNLTGSINPNDLMYVIYTSGSTGKPKGVLVPHLGFMNLIMFHQKTFGNCSSDRMSQSASSGFDAMALEVWPCMTCGATLHIANENIRHDPFLMMRWLIENKITHSFQATAIVETLINSEWPEETAMHTILTGGDRLHSFPDEQLPFKLYNLYGPTEDTVFTTWTEVKPQETHGTIPTIGKPIDNHHVFVLNEELQVQPIGMPGELCISGLGLARGYLNHDELTAEKFIANPLTPSERLYRTGDKVRWFPNGELEFLGRLDHQVKLRGFRIELGEIEKTLLLHPTISEAAVIIHEDAAGEKSLCAYVVLKEPLSDSDIRDFLATRLPDYMIPWYFTRMEKMPKNHHGKLDRKALPDPEFDNDRGMPYLAPRSYKEMLVAGAWHDVLHVKQIGIRDNFFVLGGDSIKAIQVCYELQKHGYHLDVADIFKNATVEAVTQSLTLSKIHIDQGMVQGSAPLHPIQRWFFENVQEDRQIWNQTLILQTRSVWESQKIQKIWESLIQHHDALRMVFPEEADAQQFNRGQTDKIRHYHFVDFCEETAYTQQMEISIENMQSQLNLANGPLVGLSHFRTGDGDFLAIIIHHLVVDGVSWRILIEDFMNALGRKEHDIQLPRKTHSYLAWCEKIEEYGNSPVLKKELSYWNTLHEIEVESILKGQAPFKRQHDRWRTQKLLLSEKHTNQLLTEAHIGFQTEVNDLLLAALTSAIDAWKGVKKSAVFLEGHGREPITSSMNVQRTVGWFTSIFPVVLIKEETEDIGYQIKMTKESMRRVPNKGSGYQVIQYASGELVNKMPRFKQEISFNYLGQLDVDQYCDLEIVKFDLFTSPQFCHPFAIEINAVVWNKRLEVVAGYHEEEFKADEITQFLNCYHDCLVEVLNHCLCQKKTQWTPSDFGDVSLSFQELEEIQKHINQLELV